jgi:circadian clock protein KaiC
MLTGAPGTGKTILAARFVYYGASRGEASVYVSFAENRRQFLSNAKKMGMDFERLEAEGTFLLIDLSAAIRRREFGLPERDTGAGH